MKLNVILYLLIFGISYSCSKQKDFEIQYYPNGEKKLEISHINDSVGVFLGYYENGKIRDSTTLINGKFDGRIKRYFSNGVLQEDCFWKNDLRDGPCTTYYESGNLRNISHFEDSITVGDVLEYRNSSKKTIEYTGNYSRVNGKSYFNYGTWYDSLGRIEKSTVKIDKIIASKVVSLHDSIRIELIFENQNFSKLRAYVSDFDKNYNTTDSVGVKTYDGNGNKVVVYVYPKQLGKQIARGFVDSYEYEEKLKTGGYRTKGKAIYWSYEYKVIP